jgi:serine protease Do
VRQHLETKRGKLQRLILLVLLAGASHAQSAEGTKAFSPAELYRATSGSVVMVYAEDGEESFNTATGTLISQQGHILTNHHVVAAPGDGEVPGVYVSFKPPTLSGDPARDVRTAVPAEVIASDANADLALLRVKAPLPAHVAPLAFGDSDRVEIGQSVAAIGHPGGGGLWTLTTGTISNVQRDGDLDVFQTDTALNPGNSGGPLVDAAGNLIGVNAYVVRLGANDLPLEGLNFSLQSNFVRAWLDGLEVPLLRVAHRPAADVGSAPDTLAESPQERISGNADRAFGELDALTH